MDDVTRRMRQEFDSFFPRSPELRATIQGEGAERWLVARGDLSARQRFAGLTLVSASYAPGSDRGLGSWLEFVATDPGEEITVPTEMLRDLLTALQELPDAARLLVGSEITLSFRPGT